MDTIYQDIAILRDKIADFFKDGKRKLSSTELKELNRVNKELVSLVDTIVSWSFNQKQPVNFRMGRKLLNYLKNLSYQPQTKEFYGQINLAKKGKEYQIISRIGFDHSSNFFSMLRGEIMFHSHPHYSTYGKFKVRPYSPPSEADIYGAYRGIIVFPLLAQKEIIITPEGLYVIEPKNAKEFLRRPPIVEYRKEIKDEIYNALKKPLDNAFRVYYHEIVPNFLGKKDFLKKTEAHAKKMVNEYNKVMDNLNLMTRMTYYPWLTQRKTMEYTLENLIPLGAQPRGTLGIYGISEKEFEGYSQTRPKKVGGN